MAETYRGKVSTVQKWTSDFQSEFVRSGPLKRFMGTSGNNVIQVNDTDLKSEGDSVDFPFVSALRGDGVTGNTALVGREEQGQADTHRIFIDWRRNGVVLSKKEQKATYYDQLQAYRQALKQWGQERLKYDMIAAFLSMGYEISVTSTSIINHSFYNWGYPTDGVSTTPNSAGVAGTTQKNNWVTYNAGRVLFGATTSNYSSTFATATGNVDTSSDKMSYTIMDIAKSLVQDDSLNPRIYPLGGTADKYLDEYYVCFHHPIAFQYLRDSLGTYLSNAEARGRDNPLFAAGDLMWNGILHTALPGLPVVADIGNGSSDVVTSFLCGKSALGLAWGQLPTPTEETSDLGFRRAIGIEMQYGVEKLLYTNTSTGHKVQNFVTIFTSAGY